MKKFFVTIVFTLFVAVVSFGQVDRLVKFKVESKQIQDGLYELKALGQIKPNWHLYGNNPAIKDLEAVKFSFNYENIQVVGQPVFDHPAQIINDPIFKKVAVYTGNLIVTQQIKVQGTIPANLQGVISMSLGNHDEFQQVTDTFTANLAGGVSASIDAQRIKIRSIDIAHPQTDCGKKGANSNNSFLAVFFLGFLGGLIALLTPCVFPMIPVTVSFFTKRSSNRNQAIKNGALYGCFILLIYVFASIPFHLLGNVQPEVFNNISTSPLLNIIFFLIFIVFAISFFGYFEISLPTNFASKADSKSGLSSVGGIFFMALTLAIVSFSCTGPILGTLLVGSLHGGAWSLTAGLAGFGLALAFPFALFAVFPNWLHSLPKSGGWLDTIKKILAFVELALAFKFLSNADLVMHWGFIKRETFFALWIFIAAGLSLYLFGILRLPHDYKGMKITPIRKVLGVIAFLFTLYLLPGVSATKYANLQLLSGFPPPLHYSIYGKENIREKGLEANLVNDYDKALQLARAQHKPLLIDFTGWACVNCRKMEENIWTDPQVYHYIQDNFILVSLYVDDKKMLPIAERFTFTTKSGAKKDIATIGDKWATFQAENFNQVTQPLYVILNTNEELLNNPIGYTPDAKEYKQWLQCGKEAFERK